MAYVSWLKDELMNELWLPSAQRWGSILYPRLKNKRMNVLTLTSDVSFQEVIRFEEEKLTEKECIVAWTHSYLKKLRLETEIGPARVFGPARYENCASSPSFAVEGCFPFDLINLDFSSQDPSFEIGRVEREIGSLEHTIRLQKAKGGNSFILFYTTILNSNELDYTSIVEMSNHIPVLGWSGLHSEGFLSKIGEQEDKMLCIETVLGQMCTKHGYGCESRIKAVILNDEEEHVAYSIAVFVRRR